MGTLKIILYTVQVNAYDRAWPIAREEGLEYFLFTDLPARQVMPPWNALPMPDQNLLSARRWSRIPKMCPHWYLPPHGISIYADANLLFHRPILSWCLRQIEAADVAVHPHPHRKCTYDEAARCLQLGLDNPLSIADHVAKLRAEGFPEDLGLAENCFMIRRDSPATRALNQAWFTRYLTGSQRDQLSFMPAAWQTRTPLYFIPQNSRRNHYYCQKRHLKDRRAA